MRLRVYVEDTDLGGIVYHANYIKYCERARSEMFFQKGLKLGESGNFFAVKNLTANYIKPSYLGDLLDVHVIVQEVKKASCTLEQTITRDGKKIFEATLVLAYLNSSGKPVKMPQKIIEYLTELLDKSHTENFS